MKNKSAVLISPEVGVCIRGLGGVVSFQNDTCLSTCGNMTGQACAKGCIKELTQRPGGLKNNEFVSLKNVTVDGSVVDALVLNNDGTATSLLFDIVKKVERQLRELAPYSLTNMELAVVKMVLEGYSNTEITQKHNIARSTLKTHLNHIYRKIPDDIRKEILGKRVPLASRANNVAS